MTLGIQLLLQIVKHHQPLSVITDRGLNPEQMFTPEELKLYNFIREHTKTYKAAPTMALLLNHKEFNGYAKLKVTHDPIDVFIDKVIERQMTSEMQAFASDLHDGMLSQNIYTVAQSVIDMAAKLKEYERGSARSSRDKIFMMHEAMMLALELHDARQKSYGIKGMSLGLPFIDHVTDGVYNGDFAAIIARPGKGKTYFLLNACMKAWLIHNQPGVIFSYEMPASQLGRRCLGLALATNTDPIKKGRLSTPFNKEINKWVTELSFGAAGCPLYIVQGSMDSTLAFMEDVVFEKQPKWVGVDAAYIMRARKHKGAVSRTDNIADGAEGLKSLAMATNTSLIATYQYNRKGGGSLDNIMYSDVIGQVASLVFDIAEDKKENSTKWSGIVSKIFSILKGRDGEQGAVRVLFDVLNSRISQAEVVFNQDVQMSPFQLEQMKKGYDEYVMANPEAMKAQNRMSNFSFASPDANYAFPSHLTV